MDVITHYDMLIDSMKLDRTKKVLEIGVGTGRLAAKVAPQCFELTGIDISPKTICRAKENLSEYKNVELICADFAQYIFDEIFDVIYSSLTMMHFENKQQIIAKVDSLLREGGIFCLSIDKNQSKYIDMGTRKIKIYPDTLDGIISLIETSSMSVSCTFETEFAHIVVCTK